MGIKTLIQVTLCKIDYLLKLILVIFYMELVFDNLHFSYLRFCFWYFKILCIPFVRNCSLLLPMQPEIPFLPVFSSMNRLMRYSLGSVALGSLIVSFVESIRFMLESIRRKMKVANTTPDSCIGKVASRSSRCCLGCIEWTIKSVNRNAYILVIQATLGILANLRLCMHCI